MTKQGGSTASVRENTPSSLLSPEENKEIFSLLKKKCQSICTAVVQIFLTEAPHTKWIKHHIGVLCLIKDNGKRSYYCRLFCLERLELLWEHEIYAEIEITRPVPFFLTFEGQTGIVGFNFASEDEAESFLHISSLTIRSRNRRRDERLNKGPKRELPPLPPSETSSSPSVPLRNVPRVATQAPAAAPVAQKAPVQQKEPEDKKKKKSKKDKNKKVEVKKFSKQDIGTPMDFKHIAHLGFGSENGFELTGQDESLQPFLDKVGVSKSQLEDRQTRQFIYDFMETNRVSEVVKIERALPPIPTSAPNLGQMTSTRKAPSLPPNRMPARREGPLPSVPSEKRVVSQRPLPPVKTAARTSNMGRSAPSVQPASSGPAPPPPPMLMPPVAPVMIAPAGIQDLGMTTLKKVETNTNNSSNDLLSQIQKGFKLKSAAEREDNPSPAAISGGGGCGTDALAQALRDALASRGNAIRPESSEEDDDSNNDEDWDE